MAARGQVVVAMSARTRLINEFDLEIGAGLGALASKVRHLSLIGYSTMQENVDYCLKAVKAVVG